MGVYIDMETPKSCEECILDHKFFKWLGCNRHVSRDTIADGKRSPACPLTEVPEPHGRLIDADKLKETLDYYISEAGWSDEINKALSWVKDEFIDSEQTVIPASEEAE